MGGKIWIESEKNIGSTFIFSIELIAKNCSSFEPINLNQNSFNTKHIENSLKGINILLAEDNTINQEIVLGLLEKSGINIDIASDGKEAVELYEKENNKYKLILMDIQMPIMSGIEATNIIRAKDKDIPIIALTANAMKSDIEATKKVGMNDHIIKPINIDQLYSTIFKYISNINIDYKHIEKSEHSTKTLKFKYIDSKEALIRLNNNEKLYLKILNDFYFEYNSLRLEKLSDDEFKRAIHTLKGLSGNIGAFELNSVAIKVENENNKVSISQLNIELNKVLEELKSIVLTKNENNTTKPLIPKELKDKLFTELFDSLQHRRPKNIIPVIDELNNYFLGKTEQKIFDDVKILISDYNYKEAFDLLGDINL